jgi:hypothetical protein
VGHGTEPATVPGRRQPAGGKPRTVGGPRSKGQALAQAAYSLVRRAAVEVLTRGTDASIAEVDDFGAINGAVPD